MLPTFRRDFQADFETATGWLAPDYAGPPRCLVRFADGEASILRNQQYTAFSDKWDWQPEYGERFRRMLRDSLTLDLPDYCLGITCRECHAADHQYLMGLTTVPPDRLTFAELFCYANFAPFQDIDLSGCWVVGPHASRQFGQRGMSFPEKAMLELGRDRRFDILGRVLWWMLHVPTGPILLSCGPAAKILAADYWRATSGPGFRRQTVVDAGSAMDWKLRDRLTRHYQRRNSDLSRRIPIWD